MYVRRLLWVVGISYWMIGTTSAGRVRMNNNPSSRTIQIINRANVRVEVNWINPQNQDRMPNTQDGLHAGGDTVINSYVTHEFEVEELPHKRRKVCRGPNQTCRTARFQVSSQEDQEIIVTPDFEILHTDARSRAMEKAKEVVHNECPAPNNPTDILDQMDVWAECVKGQVNSALSESRGELEFQAALRQDMGGQLLEYACRDEEFPTTESVRNATVSMDRQRKTRVPAKYLYDEPNAKIVVLKNFIRPNTCKRVRDHPEKTVSWDFLQSDTNVRRGENTFQEIYERAFSVFRSALEMNVDINTFLSHPDRAYMRSQPFLQIGSVPAGEGRRTLVHKETHPKPLAVLFIFCGVPKKGGAIHFPNLGVHYNPVPGEALLISFANMNTGERASEEEDAGDFTEEFVECPFLDEEGGGSVLKFTIT